MVRDVDDTRFDVATRCQETDFPIPPLPQIVTTFAMQGIPMAPIMVVLTS
jgi:hypothetical protein